MDFSSLQRCADLKGEHVASAVQSSEGIAALAKRFAQIAKPGSGGSLILIAFGRLGTTAVDWIDGELRIELVADGDKTKIIASSSLGAGFREALFPTVTMNVPLAEFVRTIEKSPKVIEPLKKSITATRIVLTASEEVRLTSLPPPAVKIDARSILDVVVPKPPKLSVPDFDLDDPAIDEKAPPTAKPALVVRKKSTRPPAASAKTKPPPKVPRPSSKKS